MKRIDVLDADGALLTVTLCESLTAAQAIYGAEGCRLAAVQEPEPTIAPSVPQRVPMADALHVLLASGITQSIIRAKIAAIPDAIAKASAEIDFERLDHMRRDSALVNTIGTSFGLSAAQIDAMFVAADARSKS